MKLYYIKQGLGILLLSASLGFVKAQEVLELSGTITGTHTHSKKIHVTNGHIKAVAHLKIQPLVITDPTVDPDHNSCPGCKGNTNVAFSDENYIYVQEPLEAVSTVSTSTKKVHSIQYFDGLGRPMQSIGIGASPLGKDVITPIVYDEFGRQAQDYLPYAGSQNTGAYVENTTAISGVVSYYDTHYGDTTPFSQKELEASPLSRVLKQAAPGEAWKMGSGHEIEFGYQTNTANEVKRFDATTDGSYVPTLQANGYYAAGQLYKTVTKDENHSSGSAHTIEEFKDKEGRVVLKRTYGEAGSSATATAHDTYYVYDTYGNLTYVLPPKMKGSTANLAELGYQYRYDERNRLIEKQLPGKAREYMVYDTQDRLVATQDGLQRAQGAWLFTKYDQFGRVLYTGTTNGGTDRASVQSAVTAKGKNNETSGSFTHSGITVPYTNSTAYPNSITELFTVNVYDAYPSDAPSAPSSVEGQVIASVSTTPNLKGLATASYVKVINPPLGEPGGWTKTYTYYDLKARPVRSYSRNHLGGSTISDSKLDFRGKADYTKTVHKRTSGDSEQTTITYFTYDHAERLVKTEQQDTGDGTKITLAENSYDELGQLTSKKVGASSNSSQGGELQEVNYTYNIRGWLTQINDINQQGSDLFAFKINYNQLESSGVSNVQGLYNRNISETFWKTTDNVKRGYVYKYDALNRLKAGYYLKNNGAPGYFNVENITYDENGNILSLKRTGTSDTSVVLMDQLMYTYDQGNRLTKVFDRSDNTNGFKDDDDLQNNDIDYTYDVNGNMIEDKNKGISTIEYNFLNLPTKVLFENGGVIEYVYDAAGVKLQKRVTQNTQLTTTDYLDGYQYVDGKLEFYPHAEGYVKVKEDNTLQYVYHYTDHLGNVRLGYTKGSDGKAQVVEESNYYPFGLRHKGYNNNSNTITDKYKYGYQGQELQDELNLNWSSFKWRNADPALGRFMSVDPLAEDYTYNSTYAFQENKLGMGRELEGLELCVGCGFMTEYAVEALQEAGFNRAAGALQSYSSTPGSFLYDPLQPSIDFVGAVADGEYTTAGKMLDPTGVSSLPDVVQTADTAINGEGASQELAQGQLLGATPGVVGGLMTVNSSIKSTNKVVTDAPVTNTIYKRPNNATTNAQRNSVQGKPCVDCGQTTTPMVADHKTPLVVEHYTTGAIDKVKMKSLDAVQPQCTTCSYRQAGQMSNYSKKMKTIIQERISKPEF